MVLHGVCFVAMGLLFCFFFLVVCRRQAVGFLQMGCELETAMPLASALVYAFVRASAFPCKAWGR